MAMRSRLQSTIILVVALALVLLVFAGFWRLVNPQSKSIGQDRHGEDAETGFFESARKRPKKVEQMDTQVVMQEQSGTQMQWGKPLPMVTGFDDKYLRTGKILFQWESPFKPKEIVEFVARDSDGNLYYSNSKLPQSGRVWQAKEVMEPGAKLLPTMKSQTLRDIAQEEIQPAPQKHRVKQKKSVRRNTKSSRKLRRVRRIDPFWQRYKTFGKTHRSVYPASGDQIIHGYMHFVWDKPRADSNRVVLNVQLANGRQVLLQSSSVNKRLKWLDTGDYRWRIEPEGKKPLAWNYFSVIQTLKYGRQLPVRAGHVDLLSPLEDTLLASGRVVFKWKNQSPSDDRLVKFLLKSNGDNLLYSSWTRDEQIKKYIGPGHYQWAVHSGQLYPERLKWQHIEVIDQKNFNLRHPASTPKK